jgi:hypothetical protein
MFDIAGRQVGASWTGAAATVPLQARVKGICIVAGFNSSGACVYKTRIINTGEPIKASAGRPRF